MKITIEIDTVKDVSEVDKNLLLALSGVPSASVELAASPTPKPAAKAPAPTPKPAAKPAPKPEPEPEEEDEDVLGAEEEDDPIKQAVAIATALVADGGLPQVKAALAELKVKKVGELSKTEAKKFIAALS